MQEFSKIVCEEIITSPYFFHLRKSYGQSNAEWHRDEIIDRNNKVPVDHTEFRPLDEECNDKAASPLFKAPALRRATPAS